MKPCPESIPQLVDKTIWLVARGCSPTVSSVDADVQDKPARFVACTKISQPRNTALCSISLVNGAKDVAGTQSLRIKHRTARTMLASEARGFHISLLKKIFKYFRRHQKPEAKMNCGKEK